MTFYREEAGPVQLVPSRDYYYDPLVVEVARLPRKFAVNYIHPWHVRFHTGLALGFPTEEAAVRHLRVYRALNKRHPDTGDKL